MTREIAMCLYTGMSTDTGNFSFSATSAEVFSIMSELMRAGLPLSELSRILFRERSREQLRLLGRAIEHLRFAGGGRIAVMTLSRQDFLDCGALNEHADTIVNYGLETVGTQMAVLAREDEPGMIKFSLRSKSPQRIDDVAKSLGGGGHPQASGITLAGTLREATAVVVAALEQKDLQGNPLLTVAAYRDYIRKTKTEEALANINYYTMEKILADYPISDYDEEDIRILGELEAEKFKALFLEKEGIDLTKQVPKDWEEDMNVHSLAEFIAMRRDWYKMKLQQCLIYLNILELPCQGQTDPLDHYEVLSELQLKMFEMIRKELERRNRA
jgi:hypothetical protein